MRPLLPFLLLLLLVQSASAQFEVLDPGTPVLPSGETTVFRGQYADYNWTPAAVRSRQTPAGSECLVLLKGTLRQGTGGGATAVHRMSGSAGGFRALAPPLLLEGTPESWLLGDLTGDRADELLVRCQVTLDPASPGPQVPYSGRKPAAGSVMMRTTVLNLAVSPPQVLLQQDAPKDIKEFPGLLPSATGNDLVIASFGGYAGGSTAAPDAWLRYRADATGGGLLTRLPDLVMTPVPMLALQTVDLTGAGNPQLVSLRSFPQESYRQQLWAQRLNDKGFFENAPVGRGNDITLLPADSRAPGVHFLWTDPKGTPPKTHLTTLRLDAAGKPQQALDLTFPWNAELKGATWIRALPGATGPQLALALRVGNETWLALVSMPAGTQAVTLELHQPGMLEGVASLGACDLDGDGWDEVIVAGSNGLASWSPVSRTVQSRLKLPVEASPVVSDEPDIFSLSDTEIR